MGLDWYHHFVRKCCVPVVQWLEFARFTVRSYLFFSLLSPLAFGCRMKTSETSLLTDYYSLLLLLHFKKCFNWDGGDQELQTASSCIRDVFPNSTIKVNGSSSYPIKVSIVAEVGKQKMEIWSGSQKDLFRKYAAKRTKSIQTIQMALRDLKEGVLDSN